MVMSISSPGPLQPVRFERVMVFIDGSSVACRLRDAKLQMKRDLYNIVSTQCGGRELVRVYLYTTEKHLDELSKLKSGTFLHNCRIVQGHSVPAKGGNKKEKGVDVLLVSDLVYHAAQKNMDFALLLSHDCDFYYALRRVEDFGCRTGLLALCCDAPDMLKNSCDEYNTINTDSLISQNYAEKA